MSQLEVKRNKQILVEFYPQDYGLLFILLLYLLISWIKEVHVYCITRCTDPHLIYSMFLYFQEILRDTTVADACTPQHLGLLLIYHLQVKIQDKI